MFGWEPEEPAVFWPDLTANGNRGKKLKLAARANVDKISSICFRMAGHACKLIEIDEPALVESVFVVLFGATEVLLNLEFDIDFL